MSPVEYEEPTFLEEELPSITRTPASGGYPWEEVLAPIRKVAVGEARRVYTFEERRQAVARANTITRRWRAQCPLEEVAVKVRQIAEGDDAGLFGVYLIWLGEISQERRDELDALSALRAQKTLAGRAAKQAQPEAPAPLTAAQRVAAAKKAKAV